MMRASGRPLSFSLPHRSPDDPFRRTLAAISDANAEGLEMRAVVAPRAIGVLVDVQGSINPWAGSATFHSAPDLADADVQAPDPGRRRRGRWRARPARAHLRARRPARLRARRRAPRSPRAPRASGVSRPSSSTTSCSAGPAYMPVLNYFDGNLDAVAEMLAHPHTVPGLGDGGAHVATISDASFPTTLLTHWARDRTRGATFDLEWIVAQQTRATAEAVGLLDRGIVAPGYKADVNVIDFERLHAEPPRIVADLPAGGRRVLAGRAGLPAHVRERGRGLRRRRAHRRAPRALVRGARPTPAEALDSVDLHLGHARPVARVLDRRVDDARRLGQRLRQLLDRGLEVIAVHVRARRRRRRTPRPAPTRSGRRRCATSRTTGCPARRASPR